MFVTEEESVMAHCSTLVETVTKWSLRAETDVRSTSILTDCIMSSVPNLSFGTQRKAVYTKKQKTKLSTTHFEWCSLIQE